MRDTDKTKEQLITELAEIRQQITELEASQAERKQREEQLQTLVNSASFGLSLISKNGTYEYVNAKFVDIFGYTLEDIPTGKEWFEKAYPDPKYQQKVVTCWLDDLGKAKLAEVRPRAFVVTCKDGATKKDIDFRPVTLANGQQIVTYEDITERKQAQEALQKSEERFRELFENMMDGVILHRLIVDENGNPVDYILEKINHAAEKTLSWKREDIEGKRATEVYSGDTPFIERYAKVAQTGKAEYFIDYYPRFGKWYEITSFCPERGYFANVFRDITERKQAEEALEFERSQLLSIFDSTNEIVYVSDPETHEILYVNEPLRAKFKKDPVGGICYREFQGFESPCDFCTNDIIKKQKGKPYQWDYHNPVLDRDFMITDKIIRWPDGRDVRFELAVDITERKQAEETLKSETDKLQALIDGLARTQIGIDIVGIDYKILFQNQVLIERFGELPGKLCYEKYMGLEKPCDFCPMIKAIKSNKVESVELTGADGKNYELLSAPLPNPDGTVDKAIELVMDITDRKQAEVKLKESQDRLAKTVDGVTIPAFVINREHKLLDWNTALEKLSGIKKEQAVGSNNQWAAFYSHERPVMADLVIDEASESEIEKYYQDKYRKSLLIEGAYEAEDFFPALGEGGKWLHFTASPIRNEAGEVIAAIETLEDITERKQAEKALKESEERYRTTFENTGTAMVILEEDTTISLANHQFEMLSGYSKQEIEGKKSWTEFIHQEDLERMKEYHRQRRETGKEAPTQYEFRFVDREGDIKNIFLTVDVIPGTKRSIASLNDITQRKQAEEDLIIAERNFRHSLDNSPLGVRIVTAEGELLYANQAMLDICDYNSVEELKNTPIKEHYTPESYAGFRKRREESKQGKPAPDSYEVSIIRKDSEVRHLIVSRKPVVWNGEIHYQTLYQDITERKQAEKALQESEEKLRRMFQSVSDGIYVVGLNGVTTEVNKKALEMHGFDSKHELLGKNAFELIAPRDHKRVATTVRNVLKLRLTGGIECALLKTDGSEFPAELSISVLTDASGNLAGQITIARDITERKQAEEALKLQKAHLQQLFDNSPEAIALVDNADRIIDTNKGFKALFGYPIGEIKGRFINELIVPEDRIEEASSLSQTGLYKEVIRKETVRKRKDGSLVDVSILGYPIQLGNQQAGAYAIYSDITQRKRAEEALRESNRRFEDIAESALEWIWEANTDGKYTYASPTVEKILGYKPEELLGKHFYDLFHPDDREQLKKAAFELSAKKQPFHEFISRSLHKNGEVVWMSTNGVPILDKEGRPLGYRGADTDITQRKQTEEKLVDEATRRRILVEQSRDGIVILDQNGKVYEANQQFAKMLGYSPEETAQLHVWDWDTQWTKEQLLEMLGSVDAAGDHFQTYHRRKDGTFYDVEISTNGAIIAGQKLVFCVCRDITQRKQAEETLQESEEFSSSLLNNSPIPIHVVNPDTSIRFVNTALEKLTGFSSAEVIGRRAPYPWWPEETLRETLRDFSEAMHKGAERVEKLFQKKNGERFWVEITGTPVMRNGELRYYLASWFDITERKQMNEMLRREKETLFSILQNAPYGVVLVSQDGRYLYINPEFTNITGYTLEDTPTGRDWFHKAYPDPKYRHKVIGTWKKGITRGMRINRVFSVACHNGEVKEIEFRPTLLDDGSILMMLSDITERERMQAVLRQSEEKYRGLVENIDAGICRVTATGEGKCIEVSPAMSGILGYSREELLSMNVSDVYQDPGDRKKFADKVRTRGSAKNEELKLRRKDGTPIIVSNTATAVRDEKGNILYIDAILEDITESKQAEERLRAQKELTDQILASEPNAVLVIDRHSQINLVNRAFCDTFKMKRAKAEGKPLSDVLPVEILSEAVSEVFTTGEPQFNLEFRHKVDGDERILLSQIICMRREEEEEEEEEELLLIFQDITLERVTQEQLYHTRALASIGEMASGIAHEINNPLTGVIGFAQLLMQKDIPKDIEEDVKIINEGAQRVASIVKRLLVFSRQQKPERSYVNVNEVIEVALNLRKYELETGNIQVTTQLDPELPWTMADAGQLQQVFLNIIINAESEMQAAHGRGKLLLKTEKADNTIRISFKDDGPGIARKNMDKIFNPFFTTKKPGEGTGLGLSICHGIVTEHSGRIYAESKLGKGATFVVELPVITEAKQLGLAEPTADDFKKVAGARILVIDDEPAVLQFLSQLLTNEGYQVETIDNADDALEKIKGESYSLIMLDIKMPGISGIELYERLQKLDRSLARRLVFITGDVMAADTRDFLSRTKAHYIAKPFDSEQLKKEIARKLRQGA